MKGGRTYLLGWLTFQWLACGPIAAALTLFMFFSDVHGLPDNNSWVSAVIFAGVTVGYIVAVRIVFRWRNEG